MVKVAASFQTCQIKEQGGWVLVEFFPTEVGVIVESIQSKWAIKKQNTQILQFVGHFLCDIMFHCSWLWNPLPIFQWNVPQTHESNRLMGKNKLFFWFCGWNKPRKLNHLTRDPEDFLKLICFFLWKFHGLHCDIILLRVFLRMNYIPTSGQWHASD